MKSSASGSAESRAFNPRPRAGIFGILCAAAMAAFHADGANARADALFSAASPSPAQTVNVFGSVDSRRQGGETGEGAHEWREALPPGLMGETLRRRSAFIDLERLSSISSAVGSEAAGHASLNMNLFDDAGFDVVSLRATPTRRGYSLSGDLDGVPFGTMTLVVNGDEVAGSVRTPSATYDIRSTGGGRVDIGQVDTTSVQQCADPVVQALRFDAPVSASSDEDSVIDILVVWTPAVRKRRGKRMIETFVDLYVAETNKAYEDSGVRQSLHLLHAGETDYIEDVHNEAGLPALVSDLGRLATPDDGHMDEVLELRDRVGADLVTLMAQNTVGVCGRGFLHGEFSVVQPGCPGGGTFAHELGHNMGLLHDRYLDGDYEPKAYPYAHGYVNQAAFEAGASENQRWRTIMAYPDQCSDHGHEFSCSGIMRFSNPDQTYLGDALGIPGDEETHALDGPVDARRALENTRRTVAGLRDTRPALDIGDISASGVALEEEQAFTLRAEIHNRGRRASEPLALRYHRSTDATISPEDVEVGAGGGGPVAALSSGPVSASLVAPPTPGYHHYGVCLDGDVPHVNRCSPGLRVAVGPNVSIADARAVEGDDLAFSLRLSEAREVPVTVAYAISSDTAVDSVDYDAVREGTITIPPGETEGTLVVRTVADTAAEPEDALTVELVDAAPAGPEGVVLRLGEIRARGVIVDDDGDLAVPDANLRRGIAMALGKDRDEALSASDLAALRELQWSAADQRRMGIETPGDVVDLTGLEFASGLEILDLAYNEIIDASPLAHLARLSELNLHGNRIADISPIRSLTFLERLDLRSNAITDVSPVANLDKLEHLRLDGNDISDISPLASLTKLFSLRLSSNPISDVRPLENLTKLGYLWMSGASVSDISPLASLTGLFILDLSSNPISDVRPLKDLTDLRWLYMNDALVSDVSPLAGLPLLHLSLRGNAIADIAPLRHLTRLKYLDLHTNSIPDISSLANLSRLRYLGLANNGIFDIGGLAGLTGLTHLSLPGNLISNINALAGLTRLTELDLSRNLISDIGALAGLTELTVLRLSGNAIADIAALTNLNRLVEVDLGHNGISDISALAAKSEQGAPRSVHVHGNPLDETSIRVHIPALRDRGVSVYRVAALVTDASAREGEPLEPTVHLSSRMEDPAGFPWEVLLHSDPIGYSMFGFRPTAEEDDFGGSRPGSEWARIPAGALDTPIEAFPSVDSDNEPHETLVFTLEDSSHPGVTLSHARSRADVVGPYDRVSQSVGLIVDPAGRSVRVPILAPAAHGARQSFLRVVNPGARTVAHVEVFDANGDLLGPTTLSLRRGRTVNINSGDLESGNADKGLPRGVGAGAGDRRLRLWANEADALAYMRTSDGFLTSMHDVVPGTPDGHHVPIFNPGKNRSQVSLLHLINEGDETAAITVAGVDDSGMSSPGSARLSLGPRSSRTVSARELESGTDLEGSLGEGSGKWRLNVSSDRPIVVASLLESPTGHLTNLSTVPDNREAGTEGGTAHRIPLFLSASDPRGRSGLARVVNHGREPAVVRIEAWDDTDWEYDAITLNMDARAAVNFNSEDLESGNPAKGLSGGLGPGEGDWRLRFTSEADIDVLAYVRTGDGFLTSIHDTVPLTEEGYIVPTFNPGKNRDQVSRLRLWNPGGEDAVVTIRGIDDSGATRGGDVELVVPAGRARSVSARELEAGGDGLTGALREGVGKWCLIVRSDRPLRVMSLLESHTGHLANLSTVPGG